jgi:hypothetical protein
MKKLLLTVASISIAFTAIAQEATPEKNEFDKKFRFGLRITPQPTWISVEDKISTRNGIGFGFGFGLNLEYHFSNIAALLTGIGGDLESGRIDYKAPSAESKIQYWMNESKEFVVPTKENKSKNTVYTLKQRKFNTTHITIPIILKLSTKEYNGLKYFGMFGGELGIRTKISGSDTYVESGKFRNDSLLSYERKFGETEEPDIDLKTEASLIPMRFGMNAGIGTEYRLGGSTSLLFSVNYFRSFTNMMKSKSKYTYSSTDGEVYNFVKQNLKLSAVRITIGIMF